ncbi:MULTISPECIES: hypothetical protein [unclassified Bradyrhizobium]|uniref:hypothetical protein n=1 Tax=unclassified Bradyrhizobium TaxID=2631580 RepID=UPI002478A1EF|nr:MULTISPECIES: hypothetical protein [unclassified Bradyrhizobium]WGS23335.1 hypothetical protein MTX22_17920 [Bradyrhizobium sp. ISRA463]WGS30345.1 hypothetical protein MTX19_15645 [Bradyrhizobium sp. ISRA464]
MTTRLRPALYSRCQIAMRMCARVLATGIVRALRSFRPLAKAKEPRERTTWHDQHGSGLDHRSAGKGPRKANPRYKRRSHQRWSNKEVTQLLALAKANTPTGVISLKMQRPPASIASKAQREGISLRPINRSPYNRRKKAVRR